MDNGSESGGSFVESVGPRGLYDANGVGSRERYCPANMVGGKDRNRYFHFGAWKYAGKLWVGALGLYAYESTNEMQILYIYI